MALFTQNRYIFLLLNESASFKKEYIKININFFKFSN